MLGVGGKHSTLKVFVERTKRYELASICLNHLLAGRRPVSPGTDGESSRQTLESLNRRLAPGVRRRPSAVKCSVCARTESTRNDHLHSDRTYGGPDHARTTVEFFFGLRQGNSGRNQN